ncbi:MAG: RHS repeat domain-containing protein [Elusimicrobiales bacterium]
MAYLMLNILLVAGLPAFASASLPVLTARPEVYCRLTDTANPLGQKKSYQYDKMSRVTEVKDPAGNLTGYTYDALNRLTRKEILTSSGERSVITYVYDKVGNLLNAASAGGMVSFAYDALNRPVKTEQLFAGRSYAIAYAYDTVGNRTSMTTPWGKYDYTYDALNRQTGIVNPQGITVTFSYDAVGRRTKKSIFKNSPEVLAETTYSYDAAGQLLSIVNKAGGKVVAFANYKYDAVGNRIKKEDQDGTIKYRYDASNRLITAEPVPMNMPEAEVFIYDKNGNRRYDRGAWDYKYDAANRLLENSTYTYTHDLNGNLTSRTKKDDNSAISYAYNPEQQLSEVTTSEHKVQYKYDPLGRRIEKTVDGSPKRYIYDNEDIIAILDGSNNPTEAFTHGPSIDEALILTKPDGANYYYHVDGLGSIQTISDDASRIIETYSYKAYGQPKIMNSLGQVANDSPIGNVWMFAGREYESKSGLYYNRARYLDPTRGAFTQEDPIGFMGGVVNLYSYAKNNAARYIDPSGNIIPLVTVAIGTGVGLATTYITRNEDTTATDYLIGAALGAAGGMLGGGVSAALGRGFLQDVVGGAASGALSNAFGQGYQRFISNDAKSLSENFSYAYNNMDWDWVAKSGMIGAIGGGTAWALSGVGATGPVADYIVGVETGVMEIGISTTKESGKICRL